VDSELLKKMITSTVISGQRAGWICIRRTVTEAVVKALRAKHSAGPPLPFGTNAGPRKGEIPPEDALLDDFKSFKPDTALGISGWTHHLMDDTRITGSASSGLGSEDIDIAIFSLTSQDFQTATLPLETTGDDSVAESVVRYEPARYASISTTTRATLMRPASHSSTEQWATLSSSLLLMKPPRHGPARSSL
jgi:hypothetical protein